MPFEAPVTTATLPLSLFMGPYLAGAEHRVNDEALARALVRRQSHQRLPWSRLTPGQTMFVSWIISFHVEENRNSQSNCHFATWQAGCVRNSRDPRCVPGTRP